MDFIRLFYKNLIGQRITEDEYEKYVNNNKQNIVTNIYDNTNTTLEDLENEQLNIKKMINDLKNDNLNHITSKLTNNNEKIKQSTSYFQPFDLSKLNSFSLTPIKSDSEENTKKPTIETIKGGDNDDIKPKDDVLDKSSTFEQNNLNIENQIKDKQAEQIQPIPDKQDNPEKTKIKENDFIPNLSDSLIIDSIEKVQNIILGALNSLSEHKDDPKSLLSLFKNE